MPSEKERLDVLKSMAYDLSKILKRDPDKTYTVQEIEAIIDAYITGAEQ